MSPNTSSIGSKVQRYRKQYSFSQLQLELAINASTGMISRIEADKTNPTKETLFLIAEALNLSQVEREDLFGIKNLYPTQEEIQSARNEAKEYFQSDNVVAYLIDDWTNLQDASLKMKELFGVDNNKFLQIVGKNLLEIALNPIYGLRQKFDPEKFKDLISQELIRVEEETPSEYYKFELKDKLKIFPELQRFQKDISKNNIFSPENKLVHLLINDKKVKARFSRERLKDNPRFEIIEYFNFEAEE